MHWSQGTLFAPQGNYNYKFAIDSVACIADGTKPRYSPYTIPGLVSLQRRLLIVMLSGYQVTE